MKTSRRAVSIGNGSCALAMMLVVTVGGCDGAPPEADAVTQRDSADVVITEVRSGTAMSPIVLTPAFRLGGGADADHEFYRISAAVVLSDGRFIVANSGTHELRAYDPTGAFLVSAGREGEGPGEFGSINWIGGIRGDSIMAYDWSLGRVQVFDRDLGLGRVTLLRPTPEMRSPGVDAVAPYPDGRLLGRGAEMLLEYPREPLHRHVFTLDQAGEVVDSLGPFPGGRRIWLSGEPAPLFPRNAAFVLRGDVLYTAISESDEFRVLDAATGRLRRIVRGGVTSRPPTQREIDRGRSGANGHLRWIADLVPFWSHFAVDDAGRVWRRAHLEAEADQASWSVVAVDGSTVASLSTARSFRPLDFGEASLLALERDSLGVESVVWYDIVESGR